MSSYSMRKRTRRAIVLAAALSLVLTACAGGGGEDADNEEPAAEFDRDAEIVMAVQNAPGQYDPVLSANARVDQPYQELIYDALLSMRLTEDGTVGVAPALAESYEVSDDGLTVTFALRDDVVFSDGTPFDSSVVAANVDRAKTLTGSTLVGAYASVESVDTPDDYTVIFNLSAPDFTLLMSLAGLPGFQVSPAAFDTDLSQNPVGTSPYVMESSSPTQLVVVRRDDVENIWDDATGLAARITVDNVLDDPARLNGFQTLQYDVISVTDAIAPAAADLVADGTATENVYVPGFPRMVYMNASNEWLGDAGFRKALSLALDRDAINDGLFGGLCEPVEQIFPRGIDGFDESLEPTFDTAAAIDLIEAAGYDGSTLRVTVPAQETWTRLGEVVQSQWADVGVSVEIVPVDGTTVRAEFRAGGADISLINESIDPPNAYSMMRSLFTVDSPGGVAPEITAAVEEANEIALTGTPEEATAALQEVNRLAFEDAPLFNICQASTSQLFQPGVGLNVVGYSGAERDSLYKIAE